MVSKIGLHEIKRSQRFEHAFPRLASDIFKGAAEAGISFSQKRGGDRKIYLRTFYRDMAHIS